MSLFTVEQNQTPAFGRVKRLLFSFIDFIFAPALIFFLVYEPNFAHGAINYLEIGAHSSVINGLLHHQVPYRDVQLFFNPLSYCTPALAMAMFGKTVAVLRGAFLVGNVMSLLILYLLCRTLVRHRLFSFLASFLMTLPQS